MSPIKISRREAMKAILPVAEEGTSCCTPPAVKAAV
jgi:hypothetical protein